MAFKICRVKVTSNSNLFGFVPESKPALIDRNRGRHPNQQIDQHKTSERKKQKCRSQIELLPFFSIIIPIFQNRTAQRSNHNGSRCGKARNESWPGQSVSARSGKEVLITGTFCWNGESLENPVRKSSRITRCVRGKLFY